MKNKIEKIFLGLMAVLAIVTISMAIIGLGLEIKNEIRKDQERTSCKKMGGHYTYFEQCEAFDGKFLVLPEVKSRDKCGYKRLSISFDAEVMV